MKKIKVEVQRDHLERLSNSAPKQALAELIWNALDADATRVEVTAEKDPNNTISPLKAIVVNDNGHGIPHDKASEFFGRLGGSWKRAKRKTPDGRFLHGQEGKGRFKAFSLGRVVAWNVNYKDGKGIKKYSIEALEDYRDTFNIADASTAISEKTGVTVRITEPKKQFRFLAEDGGEQAFAEIFATYLTLYPNIEIIIEDKKIDAEKFILERANYDLSKIEDAQGKKHKAALEIIEWNTKSERMLYLCDEQGFPLRSMPLKINPGNFQFSAYIKSSYLGKLHSEGDILELAEMDKGFQSCQEEALQSIRKHFRDKLAHQASSVVNEWKRDHIYPYQEEAKTEIEVAERQVFDIIATNVNEFLPDFGSFSKDAKELNLRLLKYAVEKSPKELQLVLTECLKLPSEKVKQLADLLGDISLSSIIEATKVIADRLTFLAGLSELIFNPENKRVAKERSQLHKLVEHNAWLFGEDFQMSATDKDLTEVLRRHAVAQKREVLIQEPVKRLDGKRGIIDLMFSKTNRSHKGDYLEHLIVELKAPKVKIGQKEITQIKAYAYAIAGDERFKHGNTKWEFWVLSNDLEKTAEMETAQSGRPKGVLLQSDDPNITIWVKKWSEVIEQNKSRMKFYQDHLKYDPDGKSALQAVAEAYPQYLADLKGAEKETEAT